MTSCVVDASVSLSWGLLDEHSTYAESVLELLRHDRALAPSIWPLEITNAMVAAVRRGRIPRPLATRTLANLFRLPIDVDQETAHVFIVQDVLTLGFEHSLSAYDASYLELAIRHSLPLATQDRKLAAAAAEAGVAILQP